MRNSTSALVGSPAPDVHATAWIRSQRPPRAIPDSSKPHAFFLEQERSASGMILQSGCIFLTNKECPWRCLMCDLWKHTLTGPTPVGALPLQIKYALDHWVAKPQQIKLYNSGSFFDVAAVPQADYRPIAQAVSFAERVVVESHPRLVGGRTATFRDLLRGSLEVAMGLETVHRDVLARLNKRVTLEDFERAADWLRRENISLRAFVLVKPPFMNEEQAVEWAVKSAEFAFACGASAVSLIPVRPGNGALDRLMETGDFAPPRLATLERALELAQELKSGNVFADTWDLGQFADCTVCLEARKNRLHAMNLTQQPVPAPRCDACGHG